jgi:hypothetical protein
MKVIPGVALAALALSAEIVSSSDYVAQHLHSTATCASTPTGIFVTPESCTTPGSCTASADGATSSSTQCAADPVAYVNSVLGGEDYLMVVAYEEDDDEDDEESVGDCTTIASTIAAQATGTCQRLALGKIQSVMASVNLDGSGSLSLYSDDSCKAAIQSFSVTGENVNNGACTNNKKFYSSVTPPATFALQGFYQNNTCASSPAAFVSTPSSSCSSAVCAADSDVGAFTSTQCTTNSTASIASAFGSSSYLTVVSYDAATNCDAVASVRGYRADGTCQLMNDGNTRGATAVLNPNGSATLSLYTDTACTQGGVKTTIASASINTDVCEGDTKYLSSAIPAQMFVTQDYHRSANCSSAMTGLVSVPSASCTESTVCNTAGNLSASMEMHCTTDPIEYASVSFGNNGYLMFLGYVEATNCTVLDWVFAHLADGACQIVSLEKAASAKAFLNSDGSATLVYYNDTECATGAQTQQIPDIALNNESCTSSVKYVAQYATSNGSLVYTGDMLAGSSASSVSILTAAVATVISCIVMVL